jgi:Baseplate J-like protein
MKETCGCCEGTQQLTPIAIINRPGLDALVYRVGTHASFLETMLARLPSLGIARKDLDIPLSEVDDPQALIYPLQGLTTRAPDDPSIACLDAWATVADVLTFYQERIANEGYLRTATERRSILELARLVGYALRPGVAASVFLAYMLEKDHDVTILPANRAQSVPDPGQLPQSFETAESLEARFIWNTLQPRLTAPQFITPLPSTDIVSSPPSSPPGAEKTISTDAVYFQGTATKLKQGDPLLFIFQDKSADTLSFLGEPANEFAFVRVANVTPQAAQNRTAVLVDRGLKKPSSGLTALLAFVVAGSPPASPPEPPVPTVNLSYTGLVNNLTKAPSLPPRNSQQLERRVNQIYTPQSGIHAQLLKAINPALSATLDAALSNADVTSTPASIPVLDCAAALRVKAALFANNISIPPRIDAQLRRAIRDAFLQPGAQIEALFQQSTVDIGKFLPLDAQYDHIIVGSWVVVETVDNNLQTVRTFHRVQNVQTITLTPLDFLSGSVLDGFTSEGATLLQVVAILSVATRITLLTLETPWFPRPSGSADVFAILRSTTIYAQSECLTLSDVPLTAGPVAQPSAVGGAAGQEECLIQGSRIELAQLYPDLKSGRRVIVSGERADVAGTSGVVVSELVMLAGVTQDVGTVTVNIGGVDQTIPRPGDQLHTFLELATPLSYTYKCDTVTIYGNVVRATHGETRNETLGNGDGSKALQRFPLRQSPLTYLAAPTPAGAASTLQAWINNIQWHEVDSLADSGPTDRNFIAETDDGGKTTVIFGNGQHGARLPTGVENVKAVYRTGIGKPGNVQARQITLLATKPLGVKSVINPLRASGGADKESRDSARRNVPLALLALDRLVSVEDYEDFARTYAGIGKASAASLSDGRRQLVHLSIAGADNIPIDANSDLYQNLLLALHQLGDPNLPLQVDVCEVMFIVISAAVRLLPDYLWESVESTIRTTLLDTFSFERRDLGQPVFQSEVFSAIQGVAGVDYVDLQVLGAVDQAIVVNALDAISQNPSNPDPQDTGEAGETDESEGAEFLELLGLAGHKDIPVHLARFDLTANKIVPAQLAFLSQDVPDTLILTELPQ